MREGAIFMSAVETEAEIRALFERLPAKSRRGKKAQHVLTRMARRKLHRDVVRYDGEYGGHRFAFYCPKAMLGTSEGTESIILGIQEIN